MKYSVRRRGPDCWHEPDLVLIVPLSKRTVSLVLGIKLRGAAYFVTAGVYSADVRHDDAGVTELSRAREGNSAGLHWEIAKISLFLLLFTPAEQGSKGLLGTCHAVLAEVVLVPLLEQPLKERHIKITAVGMSFFERIFLAGLVGLVLLAAVFPYIPRTGARCPFLPLMLISVSCAIGNIYVWGFTVTQHFRKLDAVKSYLDAQRPK
ncbi:unnamed protein product [Peronospora effusa]|nr:unnamed protein product [Peronospora effusa]